jgi:double-strand break repair protein AddB
MFEPSDGPRVFGVPPGVDFPRALMNGLVQRCGSDQPDALARVHLVVNTRRMARRIRDLFDAGPPLLLPRVSLLTELGQRDGSADVLQVVPPLRRRLDLAQLIGRLLDQQPDLAARAALFDLADSLAELMDEMQGEGVSTKTIKDLDVSDISGHWARAQSFFAIADQYVSAGGEALDAQARQRKIVESLIAGWQVAPPRHPIILAGSTGSRGTTQMLMAAIANLPQGAVVLPGYDFDQPDQVWSNLDDAMTSEDHPQFRFRSLMRVLDISADQIRSWTNDTPPSLARNRLVSLALRPAPVTDAWMTEGPSLRDLAEATAKITLVEAASPREEAMAIAMRLRQAAETGQSAALITPDRMLTRQVSAALDRWNIIPDDSAGLPLHLSPPGRFLRHVADLFCDRLTGETLLTLLKHPLCHDGKGRGDHLLHTRDLELHLRRNGPPFPDPDSLSLFSQRQKTPPPANWIDWVSRVFCGKTTAGQRPLCDWVDDLRALAEVASAGSLTDGAGTLWDQKAGQKALEVLQSLEDEAQYGGSMTARDFANLLGSLLSAGEVRDRDAPHSKIMIWGTLEARVQGADLLILGSLNEGSWPEAVRPDPWLNRSMRDKAGLLLPERRIGLSAHDFQQAVAAPEVWMTRSVRSDDAQTVASRWLNRLTNLLDGLPDQGGRKVLTEMRDRGNNWLTWVSVLEEAPHVPPAPRPSPRPPVAARPRQLSVTEIKRLIRDPYAIYARHVLKLKPLDPLVQAPDPLLRGIVVHDVLEKFVRSSLEDPTILSRDAFLDLCRSMLAIHVPWPTARIMWLSRISRIADDFLVKESARQSKSRPIAFEARSQARLDPLDFVLVGRADRIDMNLDGSLNIYDYKTGTPPSQPEQARFDKQLLLTAALAELSGFEGVPPAPVASAVFLGIGGTPKDVPAPLEKEPSAKVWDDLRTLIGAYLQPGQGYTSRRMLQKDSDKGDYDHLARLGEWDHSIDPTPEDLT